MASKKKIFLGPQIRRIRRENALTQAELAAAIGVSPSYVNLMERNQRPVSAEILVKLSSAYGVELSQFDGERTDELFADLADAFADPIFTGAGVTREDAFELAAGNPVLGDAVASLFRAWRAAEEELLDARIGGRRSADDPAEEARGFLHANQNHFPEIDAAGEEIKAKR